MNHNCACKRDPSLVSCSCLTSRAVPVCQCWDLFLWSLGFPFRASFLGRADFAVCYTTGLFRSHVEAARCMSGSWRSGGGCFRGHRAVRMAWHMPLACAKHRSFWDALAHVPVECPAYHPPNDTVNCESVYKRGFSLIRRFSPAAEKDVPAISLGSTQRVWGSVFTLTLIRCCFSRLDSARL